MSQNVLQLHGGLLTQKSPSPKPKLPTKKATYTGKSARNMRRKASAKKKRKLQEVMASVPPIQSFFKKPSTERQPLRKCKSKFSSKNDHVRVVQEKLQTLKRKRKTLSTSSGARPSSKGHKQHANGAVRKRTRKLSRSSRKAAKAKQVRAAKKLKKKPKLAHLVTTVRSRLLVLQQRLRSSRRCSIGQSLLLRDMHKILLIMLENTFNTSDGLCTVSHNQAANVLKTVPGHRTLAHTKTFLHTGNLPQSNRGGKREGRSLLDEEVFRSKASLWVKEQIALHTQRRLRAIRKKGSKFVSQSHVPMAEKTTANINSRSFQRFVENTLLAEFYSEKAVRARAQAAAVAEKMNEKDAKELEDAMWKEVSGDTSLFTVSDRTARRWLNELGFKYKHKQGKGVYHDGHDRADVQKYLHQGFLPRVKNYMRRTRIVREMINTETGETTWEEFPPELEQGEREVIWLNQDESLFYCNDDAGGMWCESGKNYIKVKGM